MQTEFISDWTLRDLNPLAQAQKQAFKLYNQNLEHRINDKHKKKQTCHPEAGRVTVDLTWPAN